MLHGDQWYSYKTLRVLITQNFFVRALACPSYPLNEITKKSWGLEVNVYLPRVQAIIKFTGKALQHQHLKMQLM